MSERILIIDDEEHIRRMMRLTLEAAGYTAGEAGDGLEGVSIYGDGSEWDCVVLDQRMPGMDGLETLRQLKAANTRVRVVMATAYASIELAVEAMKLGAADFVRKPMTPDTLRNAVAAALVKNAASSVGEAGESIGPIETITMNGFSILDPEKGGWHEPDERLFTIVSPAGERHEVLVQIDAEAFEYVARLARRRLPPGSSFWTEQARRLLADDLWNRGEAPRARRLRLEQLDRDAILAAERWNED